MERQLKRKPATINRHLATLQHVARWIVSQRPFLAGNPTEGIADLEPDDPEWRWPTAAASTMPRVAVANRCGVQYAKELSGHASDRYIRRYVQPSDEEKARAVEELY